MEPNFDIQNDGFVSYKSKDVVIIVYNFEGLNQVWNLRCAKDLLKMDCLASAVGFWKVKYIK